MRAGRLRTRIAIERKVAVADTSLGGETISWQPYIERSAESMNQSGREFEGLAKRYAEVSSVFRVRYTPGLSPKTHRVKVGARAFDLVAVLDIGERHEETQLVCVEAVA